MDFREQVGDARPPEGRLERKLGVVEPEAEDALDFPQGVTHVLQIVGGFSMQFPELHM